MRPPTDRQEAILLWLGEEHRVGKAFPPSTIAYGIGMDKLPAVEGGGSGRGRGSGHRVFNPAQRIISSLVGLTARGLIAFAKRPDGRSGSAYQLTHDGELTAARIRGARL